MYVSVSGYNWLQFNGNSSHSGFNYEESIISPTTVASLSKLFKVCTFLKSIIILIHK